MFYGILGVTAIAFACSTEFIPELNDAMKLVPFTEEFKMTMTLVMMMDFGACFLIEKVLKSVFSDYRPRDIAARRPDQLEKEKERKEAERMRKEKEEDEKQKRQVEEMERKLRERMNRIQGYQSGQQQR